MYHILFIHSSVNRHLGCFCVSAIINNAAVKLQVQISFKILISFPLDKYTEVELLDHMIGLFFFFFEEPPYCFPPWLHQFIVPPRVQKGLLFFTSSPTLVNSYLFDESHSCSFTQEIFIEHLLWRRHCSSSGLESK